MWTAHTHTHLVLYYACGSTDVHIPPYGGNWPQCLHIVMLSLPCKNSCAYYLAVSYTFVMFLASYAFIQGRASLGRKRGGELEDITLLPTPAAKQGKWLKTEGPKVYKCTVSFSTCIAFLHTQCMLEQCFQQQMCQLSPHYWYVSKVPARAPSNN